MSPSDTSRPDNVVMGRPKRIEDGDVLVRAREMFARHGHAVSTREIAAAVGLSQATLFQRFGSKDALFVASMGLVPLDVKAVLGESLGSATVPLEQQLTGLIDRLQAAIAMVLPAMLHSSAAPRLDPGLAAALHHHLGADELVGALEKRVLAWRRKGLVGPEVEAKILVNHLLWLVHGRVLAGMNGQALAASVEEAETRSIARLVYLGIAPRS